MAETEKAADREAQHGEKMIEVKIRFWTDDLASEPRCAHGLEPLAWNLAEEPSSV